MNVLINDIITDIEGMLLEKGNSIYWSIYYDPDNKSYSIYIADPIDDKTKEDDNG